LRGDPIFRQTTNSIFDFFIMAKAPTIKFPRIHAGFYSITFDGELVGYIAKQGGDKDAAWFVYNDNTPELTFDALDMETAVDESDLFRVSKEFARGFFTAPATPVEVEEVMEDEEMEVETVELQAPDWEETEVELETSEEAVEEELLAV
jgi:hypothetical protein